jgi:LysM repeat protein
MLVLLIGYVGGFQISSQQIEARDGNVANRLVSVELSYNGLKDIDSVVTINEGDTLWGIAQRYFPHEPVTEAIGYLKELNGLPNDVIKEGDTLKLF